MSTPFVSVVIPVYDDWARLSLCINALLDQSYPRDYMEIIVVNNHPDASLPPVLIPDGEYRIINEHKRGSYAARNTGIRMAKGEIFGFTDSDCIPDKDWVRNAVDHFREHQACARLAGRVALFYQSKTPTPVELYETVYAFNQDLYVKNDGTGVTANLFSRREVFDEVGLFDERLMSGGDYEWSVRARKAGHRIDYAENVIVQHPARSRMEELVRKSKRVGGGQALFFNGYKVSWAGAFARFLYDLRPPVKSFRLLFSKGKELSLWQKLRAGSIRYYLSLIGAYEKFKVRSGKKPNRI